MRLPGVRIWLLAGLCLAGSLRAQSPSEIRYVALGDSYTIGEGALASESWPALLTRHLAASGLPITLVANPSVTGWTTQDVLEREIPVYLASRPTFATLQIGVNDWVSGASPAEFRRNLRRLLDQMQSALPDQKNLLLVNIPDFSVTPAGRAFSRGRHVSTGLAEFNTIIADEANARSLPLVDIFALSQKMSSDPTLVALDGLHPSAREYAEWEKIIFPRARELLTPRHH